MKMLQSCSKLLPPWLFLSCGLTRSDKAEVFASSQQTLNVGIGLANTFILLTSSWFVALAVHSVKSGMSQRAARLITLGMGSGCAFIVLKVFEYHAKIHAGINLLTNDFYMYYFVMTFIHFLHVIVGLILLFIAYRSLGRSDNNNGNLRFTETAATFWHMVDLLWVVLFPFLYLTNGL